ncbi:MAG: helicase [Myxococcales bacterium]|nr:MAG: helicase [Myxococcales bacterium]
MPDGSVITAALGPTNTGKTHRAIERLLTYDTGMIGLPLRLLAREVYDKISARVGESRVALITGEERRVPRRPDYWVCTVESMPLGREVEFLAVDEIQLAAHPQRGHVFTDRLLNARGTRETWFLGAETMRRAIESLVPTAQFVEAQRMSKLTFSGASKLTRLPSRSAVVAFSAEQVYELAEKLRAQRGGTAVVLGSLSPQTRNAQVAMFQAGEVDTLVATDAIGMGLNLQVNHVAFAALRKFDGREVRRLDVSEIGQIAGRAGRYQTDGTFGSVAPLEIGLDLAADLEAHRFPRVERLVWRNSMLAFGSIDELMASLRERPRSRWLVPLAESDDLGALEILATRDDVRALARGERAVRLLWEVCSVPDFRKLLLEHHATLLHQIYGQLASRGVLDEAWLAAQVDPLDDIVGDIDTLMGRISAIRTWTYVSHRDEWTPHALGWQERTRQVESRLSDALHEGLVRRFVEKGQGRKKARRAPVASAHPFARLALLGAPEAAGPAIDEVPWYEELIAAGHDRFELDARGHIAFEGRPVGQLVRGARLLLPDAKLRGVDELPGGARLRVQRRLLAYARDEVQALLFQVNQPSMRALSVAGEGLRHRLEQGLGTVALKRGDVRALTAPDRSIFHEAGVVIGRRVVYSPLLLDPDLLRRRAALAHVFLEDAAPLAPAGEPSRPLPRGVAPEHLPLVGYVAFGTRAVRADVVERVARAVQEGADPGIDELAVWLGCEPADVPWIVDAMELL